MDHFLHWLLWRHGHGEDETARALRDIERQDAHLAGLAHLCAGVLILLFSLGSLISLSAAAFNTVLTSWQHGRLDIPAAISVAVSTLLVLAMDTAMLYSASVIRVLAVRGARGREAWGHWAVLISAALLEAATYTYMTWLYDRPETWALWALAIARAVAAPAYAVYLSMARALPIGPRDIFAQAELAAGRGVLRDVTALANDRGAPLDRKLRIMGAASLMPDRERSRLAELIAVVNEAAPLGLPAPALALSERSTTQVVTPEPEPPTTPKPSRKAKRDASERSTSAARAPVLMLASGKPRRADAGRRSADAQARWLQHTEAAADMLTLDPHMSTRELARRMGVGVQRATEVRRMVQPVRPERATQDPSRSDISA